ncbi:MAG: hypothetical protein QXX41_07820 [Nitrososphaerota archaeon]
MCNGISAGFYEHRIKPDGRGFAGLIRLLDKLRLGEAYMEMVYGSGMPSVLLIKILHEYTVVWICLSRW